jgi:endonuclease/exonuclease/phosphatase family metal-dependent hydrolase
MKLTKKFRMSLWLSMVMAITSCGVNESLLSFENQAPKTPVSALTYNTYLLNGTGTGTHTKERIELMPDQLAKTGADFIFLQEVWEIKHRNYLIEQMQSRGYPHAAFYENPEGRTGWDTLGNGMLILSAHEFSSEVSFEPWSNWTRLLERKSSKGVMGVNAKLPSGQIVSLFTAHTSTKLFKNGEYKATHIQKRLVQIEQVAAFMEKAKVKSNNAPQILGIDLNTHIYRWNKEQKVFGPELAPSYQHLLSKTNLQDSDLDPDSAKKITYDPAKNHWGASGFFADDPALKLDYLFVSTDIVNPESSVIKLTEEFDFVKDNEIFRAPLSDHYGILSKFFL